ncbi:hypothetical protein [Streptomyces sp. NPDC001635]
MFLSGLVTVGIVWFGARLALNGSITVGELVAFHGASAFLTPPVSTATEAAETLSLAKVATGRVCVLLRTTSGTPEPFSPEPLPDGPLSLVDETAGITAEAGLLTVITTLSDQAELHADRLIRGCERSEQGEPPTVLLGGVPLHRVDPAVLHSRVLRSGPTDTLFSGTLREELTVTPGLPAQTLSQALFAAAADVVYSLPAGLETP